MNVRKNAHARTHTHTHTHTFCTHTFAHTGPPLFCRRAARGGRKDYTDKAASESEGGDSDEEEDFNADEFEVTDARLEAGLGWARLAH